MSVFQLLKLELSAGDEVTSLRHVARRAALLLGFDDIAATRVATAISELGRLGQGRSSATVRLAVADSPDEAPALTISFRWAEPAAVRTADVNVHRAVGRLMDGVETTDDSLVVRKLLTSSVDHDRLVTVRDELLRESATDQGALLQSLNEELVAALNVLRERESQLVQVNSELDETNRGVVRLYAELERRSTEVRDAQRIVFEELEAALRPPPPRVEGVTLAVRYVPAQANSPTGGDLYDWFVRPDGCLHITVVDVRGHGVESTRDALYMTHTVRTLILEGHEIGEVLARADRLLQSSSTAVVATALLARLDVTTGVVQLAGAGHPPALRVPADSPPVYLEASGRPIGYEGGGSREVTTVQLDRGDCVLLYTDGIIEIRRDVLEGLETLAEVAGAAHDGPLPDLLQATLDGCLRGDVLTDDTLLIAARWNPLLPAARA